MKMYRKNGFSVVELLFVLAIMGIVAAIAIPSMQDMLNDDRLTSYRNTLFADLRYARSIAITENQAVTLCVSSDQATCTGGSFEDGWIIFWDQNFSGALDAADFVKIQQQFDGGIEVNSPLGTSVLFDSRGFTPNTNGIISVCDDRGVAFAETITISATGRAGRGATPTCP